jgi:hypothetical protein
VWASFTKQQRVLAQIIINTYYRNINRVFSRFFEKEIVPVTQVNWGTRYRSWLTHYSTSRKVSVSIPEEVIGFFNWPNPSGRIVSLGSTQPLTEMSTTNLPGGKGRPERKADKLTAIYEPNV